MNGLVEQACIRNSRKTSNPTIAMSIGYGDGQVRENDKVLSTHNREKIKAKLIRILCTKKVETKARTATKAILYEKIVWIVCSTLMQQKV